MLPAFKIIFTVSLIIICNSPGFSQAEMSGSAEQYREIYTLAVKKTDAKRQLLNGIYYENPYYNATGRLLLDDGGLQGGDVISSSSSGTYYENPSYNPNGHPFLNDGSFYEGAVLFRNTKFDQTLLKYDIFHQQLVVNPRPEDPMLMVLLSNEFVTGFWIGTSHFRKLLVNGNEDRFLQVIWEEEYIACYRAWYKLRYKSYDEGDNVKDRFSERKQKSYLEVQGTISRYGSNASFLKLIPEKARRPVKAYLKAGNIKVNKADQEVLKEVIHYCQEVLAQNHK